MLITAEREAQGNARVAPKSHGETASAWRALLVPFPESPGVGCSFCGADHGNAAASLHYRVSGHSGGGRAERQEDTKPGERAVEGS